MSKVEELIAATKLGELMHKKEQENDKKTKTLWIIAIALVVIARVGVVYYALYKHFSTKCVNDFEDDFEDFEDDFDDDFFEDETV